MGYRKDEQSKWEQQDATRNAIQMLGQTHFSHKQLDKKSCDMIQDMLFIEKGINFNDCSTDFKRGICCIRQEVEVNGAIRHKWIIDKEIPIFSQQPEYIEKLVLI